MKTGRLHLALVIAAAVFSANPVLADPVDAGASEASRQKAARQVRIYNEQPKEAFQACSGRAAAVPCVYSVTPSGASRSQRVEGSCWVPENSQKLPLVCF